MRKSLQKTPPSGLSSRLANLSAGLLAAGAVRRAPRRNGANGSTAHVAVAARRDGNIAARLRLLEGFLGRAEISDSAQHALMWLAETAGVTQSICLVRPVGEQVMAAVAAQGLPLESASTFSVSLDDWNNPLIAGLNRRHTFYATAHSAADRRRRPSTPLEDAPFHAVPLGLTTNGGGQPAFGLLLYGGPVRRAPDLVWLDRKSVVW